MKYQAIKHEVFLQNNNISSLLVFLAEKSKILLHQTEKQIVFSL